MFKACLGGNVINYQNTVASPVIGLSDGPVAFLSSSVPQLQFDPLLSALCDDNFASKIDTNGPENDTFFKEDESHTLILNLTYCMMD